MSLTLIIFVLFPFSKPEIVDYANTDINYPIIREVELKQGDSFKIYYSTDISFIAIIGEQKFYLSVTLESTSKSYYATKPGLYAIGNQGTAIYTALEAGNHKIFAWATSYSNCRKVIAKGSLSYIEADEINIDPSPFAYIQTDPNALIEVKSDGLWNGKFVIVYNGETKEEYNAYSGKFSLSIKRLVILLTSDSNYIEVTLKSNGDTKFDYGEYTSDKLEITDKPFFYTAQDVIEYMIEGTYVPPSESKTDSQNTDSQNTGSSTTEKESDSSNSELNSDPSESESMKSESDSETNTESDTEATNYFTESNNFTESETYTELSISYSDTENDDSKSDESKSDDDDDDDDKSSKSQLNRDDSNSSSKLSKGAISGITISCIVAVAIIVIIVIVIIRRMKEDNSTYDIKSDGDSGMEIEETRSDKGNINNDPTNYGVNRKSDKDSRKRQINFDVENFNDNQRNDKNSQNNPIVLNDEKFGEKKGIVPKVRANPQNNDNFEDNKEVERSNFGNNRRNDRNSKKKMIDANIENISDNPQNDDFEDIPEIERSNFGNNRRNDRNSKKKTIDANIENVSDNPQNDDFENIPEIEVSHFGGNPQNDEGPIDIDFEAFDN